MALFIRLIFFLLYFLLAFLSFAGFLLKVLIVNIEVSGNMGFVKPMLNKFVYKCNYGYCIKVICLEALINLDAIPSINLKFIKFINKYYWYFRHTYKIKNVAYLVLFPLITYKKLLSFIGIRFPFSTLIAMTFYIANKINLNIAKQVK